MEARLQAAVLHSPLQAAVLHSPLRCSNDARPVAKTRRVRATIPDGLRIFVLTKKYLDLILTGRFFWKSVADGTDQAPLTLGRQARRWCMRKW